MSQQFEGPGAWLKNYNQQRAKQPTVVKIREKKEPQYPALLTQLRPADIVLTGPEFEFDDIARAA